MSRDPFADDDTGEQSTAAADCRATYTAARQSLFANVPSTKDELDKSEAPGCTLTRESHDFTRVSRFPARIRLVHGVRPA
jgi:hypothetical protein